MAFLILLQLLLSRNSGALEEVLLLVVSPIGRAAFDLVAHTGSLWSSDSSSLPFFLFYSFLLVILVVSGQQTHTGSIAQGFAYASLICASAFINSPSVF